MSRESREKARRNGDNDVDWAAELKEAAAAVDAEGKRWGDENIPSIKAIWRMGDDEFMHHIELLTLRRLVKEFCGISEEEYLTYINEMFLEETKKAFDQASSMKQAALRAAIVGGARPPVI